MCDKTKFLNFMRILKRTDGVFRTHLKFEHGILEFGAV